MPRLSGDLYLRITGAFDKCLHHWFAARDNLVAEELPITLKNDTNTLDSQMKAMSTVLKQTARIRRIYVVIEILAPVVFAVVAVLFAWYP